MLDDLSKPKRAKKGYKLGVRHHRAKHDTATVERARELRERHGWSYNRIAIALDVSMWTVREWCRYGTRFVS
jgi:DNA-binding transcriptional regulator YiaG